MPKDQWRTDKTTDIIRRLLAEERRHTEDPKDMQRIEFGAKQLFAQELLAEFDSVAITGDGARFLVFNNTPKTATVSGEETYPIKTAVNQLGYNFRKSANNPCRLVEGKIYIQADHCLRALRRVGCNVDAIAAGLGVELPPASDGPGASSGLNV